MHQKLFVALLTLITILGLAVRMIDYDRIPGFAETKDEFFYPWSGMTLLLTGKPTSWSWFDAYPKRTVVSLWGDTFPLVTPWVEKPPLYSLVTGGWMLIAGVRDITQVRLSTLRLIPVMLSVITLVTTAIVGSQVFSKRVGLLSALLYATIPTVVMANRLSLTENLLTPITLGTTILLLKPKPTHWQSVLVAVGGTLAVLTKNIGLALPLSIVVVFWLWRRWKAALVVLIASGLATLIHPAMGWYYDWQLYTDVMSNYRHAHSLNALPEFIQTIFSFPTVTSKEHLFVDGAMLLGYILFFSSPLWLIEKAKTTRQDSKDMQKWIFLSFPFAYMTLLTLLVSGIGFSFFGWHLFPLFPFLTICLAQFLIRVIEYPHLYDILLLAWVYGTSSIRFGLNFFPRTVHHRWQYLYAGLLVILITNMFLKQTRWQRLVRLLIVIGFISINLYTSINLRDIYPTLPQP